MGRRWRVAAAVLPVALLHGTSAPQCGDAEGRALAAELELPRRLRSIAMSTPGAMLISEEPPIVLFDGFLSAKATERIVRISASDMQYSQVQAGVSAATPAACAPARCPAAAGRHSLRAPPPQETTRGAKRADSPVADNYRTSMTAWCNVPRGSWGK